MKNRYCVSAIAAISLVLTGILGTGVTSAQTDELPSATAIPVYPVATATPAARASVQKPASAEIFAWSPDGGQLTVTSGKVTARASSTVAFDTNTARYFHVLSAPGGGTTFGSEQIPDASYENANKGAALTANVSAVGVIGVVFAIKDVDGTKSEKQFSISTASTGSRKSFAPVAMREYFYPPLNLASIAGNSEPCSAIGQLTPARTYQATIGGATSADVNDWYYMIVAAGNSVRVTLDTPPTVGTQLQLFNAESQDCALIPGTPTAFVALSAANSVAVTNLKAGRLYIRVTGPTGLPFASYGLRVEPTAQNALFEDNDNPCQATPTTVNTTYSSYVDDEYDFYEIDVTATGFVRLAIEDFNAPSQMQLRSVLSGTACSPITSTQRIGDPAIIIDGKAEIIQWVTPGKYYMRMGPTTSFNTTPYRFRWNFVAIANAQGVDICPALSNCPNAPLSGANKFTMYWGNFPVEAAGFPTELRFETELVTEKVGNCPAGTSNQKIVYTGTTRAGSREYTSLNRGFYKLKVKVLQGLAVVHYREFAIKMDCEFLAAGAMTNGAKTDAPVLETSPEETDPARRATPAP